MSPLTNAEPRPLTKYARPALWQYAGALLVGLVWLCSGRTAQAHNMRTVYLELTEAKPGHATILRQATVDDSSLRMYVSKGCHVKQLQRRQRPPLRILKLRCPGGLAGRALWFEGFGAMINEVVIRARLANGQHHSILLTAQRKRWKIPARHSTPATIGTYTWLGVTHVLGGLDHLLFVLALLLLVHGRKALVLTITAFTLSHSITLALTALDWLHVPAQAAEACIAWSLVLSAWEVTRRSQLSHPDRLGVWMGFLFGFVHGLGFAGALRSIGLPQDALVWGLVSFNIGVELGQLAFALPGFALLHWLRRERATQSRSIERLAAYGVGIPGAFWFWQRLWPLLP